MNYYDKLASKYWQEEAATHSFWALDYLLDGQLENAVRHQRIAAECAENSIWCMGILNDCEINTTVINDPYK